MLSFTLHFSLAWYKYSSLKFSGPQIAEGQMTPSQEGITGPPVLKRIITFLKQKFICFLLHLNFGGGKENQFITEIDQSKLM